MSYWMVYCLWCVAYGLVIELLLTGSLAIIMFSLGLSLKPQDFGVAFHQPKALIAGAIAQLLMLPVIAFLIFNRRIGVAY